jgi:serine/threonine protein kinase
MDPERWDRVQKIFHQVSNCKFEEQDAVLQSLCDDEADLSSEVQAMLDADRGGESLLDRGLSDVAYRTVGIPFDENAIREFGPYRLQKVLGEGGMGVVWLARRADTGHLVAIKFLPNAALSPARRNRFALEIRTSQSSGIPTSHASTMLELWQTERLGLSWSMSRASRSLNI